MMKKSLFAMVILFLFVQGIKVFGQTDTEFWFVAPEITEGHGNFPGGEPVYFRVSALELDAEVRIYQPANSAGMDTTFTVPAKSTLSIDASPWINDLENKPGDLVLNKGVHIVSNNLITVYYDEDEYWNQDIFALKGKNALGLEFYTPFNHTWGNGTNYLPRAYSSIDIVATENNTIVTITPTADVVGHGAGSTFSVTLQRGETYSCLAASQTAAGHLGGSHITSTKPIAVTLKDDSVHGTPQGCKDLMGDQTVPIINANGKRVVGYEYIVMRGKINLIDPNAAVPDPDGVATGERIFVMATEPNTQVFIDGVLLTTLTNPGEQIDYQVSNNSTHVEGDKPIMVFHAAGFGCELGGAILPTVDGCTGSLDVSFTRSTTRNFYLNITTIDAAKHAFTMHYEDSSTFTIPDTWFEPVGSTDYVCLKKENKLFPISQSGGVPQGEVVRITNSVSVFQLGLIEGGTTTGCKYGYFSEYSQNSGQVMVVESGSKSVFSCAGDTVHLSAHGGISYTWSPSDYLSDPNGASTIVAAPPGIYNYDVTIHRGCLGDTVVTTVVGIAKEVKADFETDNWNFCSGDTVTFENLSIGVDMSSATSVQWDFDLDDPTNALVFDTSRLVQHYYSNPGSSIIQKTIELVIWNEQSCVSSVRKTVSIHPGVNAQFAADVSEGCGPLEVAFTNQSSASATSFVWDFADGSTEDLRDPIHLFQNLTEDNLVFEVSLVALSDGLCADTFSLPITVYPDLVADFECDTAVCHLSDLSITDRSVGADVYSWDFGDGGLKSTSSGPVVDHYYINVGSSPVSYTVELQVENAEGCSDQKQMEVVVYPESEGGILRGDESQITFGNSTGTIFLSGHSGEVTKWQKIVNAGSWTDVAYTGTYFNEIPESADVWHYRAVIQNGACTEAYSDLYTVFVLPKELIITPDAEQSKRAGDPDPIFTFSNSEWEDNTFITGALSREYGEAPGTYKYLIGTLAAGSNYKTVLNPEAVRFTITSAVGMEEQRVSNGLRLTSLGNPFQESIRLGYSLPFDGKVKLSIRNMAGQVVKTVVNNLAEQKGDYQLKMDDVSLDAGIYFATLELNSDQESVSCTIKLVKSR
jgi:PKD repeat protein